MPNNDLISRETAVQMLREKSTGLSLSMFTSSKECYIAKVIVTECAAEIKNLPAIDVEPVKHAKWITDDLGNTLCTACKGRIPYYKEYDMDDDVGGYYDVEIDETNYCPNCGAKMDNEE